MKKTKILSIIAALLSCIMVLAACGTNPPPIEGGSGNKKVKDGDVCIGLDITHMPTKTEYKAGEKFNPAGLVFDAVYQNGFDGDTGLIGADLDGYLPRTPLTESDTKITLIFEGFRKEIDIKVMPKKLLSMEITREPDIRSYYAGDKLDLSGLTVKAEYEEGVVDNEQNITITDASGKEYKHGDVLDNAAGYLDLTVSVKAGEVVKKDIFGISVYRGMTIQAEDYVDESAELPTDRSYTVLKGNTIKDLVLNDATWTGSGYIGNIVKGVTIEFNVYTEEPINNADLVLIASSTCQGNGKMEDMQFNKFCKVYIDYGTGYEEIYIDDDVVIEGKEYPVSGSGGNKWTNWADVPFGTVNLPKGYTKVKIECTGTIKDSSNYGRTPNVDRLDIRARDGEAEVNRGDWCTDIDIKHGPDKTVYKEGETFDPTGIVFDAFYRNGYEGDKNLGPQDLRSFSPSGPLKASDTEISLNFKNFTKTITVTVIPKAIKSIAIEREPDTKAYSKGGQLNLGGLIVKAVYEDDTSATVTGYTVKDASGKVYTDGTKLDTTGDIELIVEYTVGNVTKTATFTVSVSDGITVQAEAAIESGAQPPEDSSYTVFTAGKANTTTAQGSGGGSIENVAPGTKVEFYIYSDVAFTGADLVFTLASTNNDGSSKMRDMQFNKLFKVTVGEGDGEQEMWIGDHVVIEGKEIPKDMSKWFLWSEAYVGKVDIKQGFTKVTLECIGQINCADGSARAANIDCLEVRFANTPDVRGKQIEKVELSGYRTSYVDGDDLDLEGLKVKATYEGGIVVENEKSHVVKDGSGNVWKNGDNLSVDTELFVEVVNAEYTKSAPLTLNIRAAQKITVEAENSTVSENSSYTVRQGGKLDNDGKCIGGMDKGAQLDFFVYSENAIDDATIVFVASSLDRGSGLTKDVQFTKIFELYVDDVKVEVGNDVMIKGRKQASGESLWFLYTNNNIAKVNLKAGFTKITFKVVGTVKDSNGGTQRTSNVDKIEIKY